MKRSRSVLQQCNDRDMTDSDRKEGIQKCRNKESPRISPMIVSISVLWLVLVIGLYSVVEGASPAVGATVRTASTHREYHRQHQKFHRWLEESHRHHGERDGSEDVPDDTGNGQSSPIGSSDEECRSIEKCQQCTFSEVKTYEACKATSRWEKFECVLASGGDGSRIEMRSCKYTESDEEFAMVRLQMLCLLMGIVAIIYVRRQKRISASLFDQRKLTQQQQQQQNGTTGSGVIGTSSLLSGIIGKASKKRSNLASTDNNNNSSIDNDDEIEFTPMTNQQRIELAPLMPTDGYSDDDLEVV